MTTTLELWAAVRPGSRSRQWPLANPMWDTGTGSDHVADDELTHLLPEGRAEAATADVA
ncbi:hypothetical protein MSIMFI_01648 [Mycobacterium simulans]|uniref:hypothetical protein n=1 Tax=Mycobacterium simulans TaxID=627089 RepID=UPI00174D09C1|nr:hypothetical protein [Mycobacterium simulans]SON60154.1 hypothetical protein MSIMFI_01648 [Mycobacterium simulans]